MQMYDTPHALSDYLNQTFTCSCGREHYAALRYVAIGKDALQQLPDIVAKLGAKSVYLISDSITCAIAGEKCHQILEMAGVQHKLLTLGHTAFDEATVGEIVIHMPADCDLFVAVGTGAINDMTRFCSFKMGRPFMTVATAAPMDGFASSIAALNVNNLKVTFEAQTPLAIIGDTEILKGAPYRMIAAGLGDLLGKCTCLCDWRLANLISGEHKCDRIIELVEGCVADVLKMAPAAKERDPETLGKIMEGLVLSGVAMSLYGNSRPASGCEHHMSHYWEMMFEQKGQRPGPHGAQVGVGTVLVLKSVEELLAGKVDFEAARAHARAYDEKKWEEEIRGAYGPAAEGVIELEKTAGKNDPAKVLQRIDAMEAHWEEICGLLKALPSSEYVEGLLRDLQSPALPGDIDVDRKMLKNTFLYCKEVRARYTIWQLLWDLGVLDEISDRVIEKSY